MTFFCGDVLTRVMDLVFDNASLFVVFVRLDHGLLLLLQLTDLLMQLTVLGFDCLDVLEVAVDPTDSEEQCDGYDQTKESIDEMLDGDLLAEYGE